MFLQGLRGWVELGPGARSKSGARAGHGFCEPRETNVLHLKPCAQDGPASPVAVCTAMRRPHAPEDTRPSSGLPAEPLPGCSEGFRHRLRPQSAVWTGWPADAVRRPPQCRVPIRPASDVWARRPFPPPARGQARFARATEHPVRWHCRPARARGGGRGGAQLSARPHAAARRSPELPQRPTPFFSDKQPDTQGD